VMKIPLTLLRKGMISQVYHKFFGEFRNMVEFKKYIDIYRFQNGLSNFRFQK